MESVIITKLLATAGITALTSTRIRPGKAAAGDSLPYLVLRRISGGTENMLGAAGTAYLARIQIDCIAATYSGARALADAVTAGLNGHRDIAASPRIDSVMLTDETDDDFTPTDGGDFPIHRVIQDYQVCFDTGA